MSTQRDEHIKRLVEHARRDQQAEAAPMRVRRPTPAKPTSSKSAAATTKATTKAPTKARSQAATKARSQAPRKTASKAQNPFPRAEQLAPKTAKNRTIEQKFADKKQETESQQNEGSHYVWLGIAFLFISVFLLLSCVSYLKYWQNDQNIAYWSELFWSSKQEAMNWCGRLGAIVSQQIIGRWFGISGVLLSVVAGVIALKSFRIEGLRLHKWIRSTIIVMCTGSVVMGHFFGVDPEIFGSGWGGEMGIYVSQWLGAIIGNEGTSLLLILGAVGILYFVNANFIRRVYGYFRRMILDMRRRNELRRMAQLERDRALAERLSEQRRQAMVAAAQTAALASAQTEARNEQMKANMALQPEKEHINDTLNNADPVMDPAVNTAPVEPLSPPIPMVDSQFVAPEVRAENRELPSNTVASWPVEQLNFELLPLDNGMNALVTGYYDDGSASYCYLDCSSLELLRADKAERKAEKSALHAATAQAAVIEAGDDDVEFTILERPVAEIHSQATVVSAPVPLPVAPTPISSLSASNAMKSEVTQAVEKSVDDVPFVRHFAPDDSKPTYDIPQPTEHIEAKELIVEQIVDEEAFDNSSINSSQLYDPTLELRNYKKPPVELLRDHISNVTVTDEELLENKNRIVYTLGTFGIKISSIEAIVGPTVTLYEIVPAPGVRISKIKNLEDDIALALSALGIRIIAPIPGKGTIGIEVPNKEKAVVSMYSVVKSARFQESDADLPVALGKTIQNETFVLDLAKMPHLLVAGATGQGKSVGLNAIITSLLYKKHPAELKFILVDPKKVELTLYSKLENHFLAKIPDADEAIITDTQKVIFTLNSICIEMDARYDLLKEAGVRSIKEYNAKFVKRRLNPEKGHRYLPYFVVIIDEFADLIMTAGREVETPIARIAQLARAVGIHLIIATQRPTTNIITGVIKANFPARIAFRVTSQIDSRTILDHTGANQLIGRGDMLVSTGNDITRVQCAFVDTPEVEEIALHIFKQKGYDGPYELPEYQPEGETTNSSTRDDLSKRDPLFDDVAYYIVSNQTGSASTIQRKFSIGFNRAGRIVDQLEAAGILGTSQGGSKPRQVLVQDPLSLENILENLR